MAGDWRDQPFRATAASLKSTEAVVLGLEQPLGTIEGTGVEHRHDRLDEWENGCEAASHVSDPVLTGAATST